MVVEVDRFDVGLVLVDYDGVAEGLDIKIFIPDLSSFSLRAASALLAASSTDPAATWMLSFLVMLTWTMYLGFFIWLAPCWNVDIGDGVVNGLTGVESFDKFVVVFDDEVVDFVTVVVAVGEVFVDTDEEVVECLVYV